MNYCKIIALLLYLTSFSYMWTAEHSTRTWIVPENSDTIWNICAYTSPLNERRTLSGSTIFAQNVITRRSSSIHVSTTVFVCEALSELDVAYCADNIIQDQIEMKPADVRSQPACQSAKDEAYSVIKEATVSLAGKITGSPEISIAQQVEFTKMIAGVKALQAALYVPKVVERGAAG